MIELEPRPASALLLGIAVLAVVSAFWVPAVPQDPAYHDFADARAMAGIPNALNVLSNAAFLLAGVYGLCIYRRLDPLERRPAQLVFSIAVVLIGVGSAYYHWSPSNHTLVWDRAPMTLAFVAVLALVVGDRVSVSAGTLLLWPMVALGLAAVAYWHWSELRDAGDLRPYALAQFLPILLVVVALCITRRGTLASGWLWAAVGCYLLAKIAELLDQPLLEQSGLLSGHSVKHLLAAAGVLMVTLAWRSSGVSGAENAGKMGVKRRANSLDLEP